ncbi:MAG TPA: glycine oxidase ThiO [Dehalococcoidia bacterium]|nr:glycine oxidase ThiO [Dehalococcoidia bacterium]
MSDGGEVVIVGGGIVGSACAYELAKRGAKPILLEYGKSGMQATNAAAGMLAPLSEHIEPGPMLEFTLRALREYPAGVEELQATCGFDLELRLTGILKVAFDDEQPETLRRAYAWHRQMGFDVEWLDGAACRELEPRVSERVSAGVFSAAEGNVSNQQVALALLRAAAAHGAVIHERTPVTGFRRRAGRIVAVRSNDREFACDAVVLAAGARTGQIARRLGVDLPVVPVRGQMMALGGMRQPIAHPVWGPDGYLVPRANGLVFAGSTSERVGFRRRTTDAGVRRIRATASALVPQLRAAHMHFAWAGLRPGSPDDLPFIGPMPRVENAFAATGHYRNGILLGPLTGRLVAEALLSGDWSAIPAAFSPGRFAPVAAAV